MGAAFVNSSFVNEAWAAGYDANGVGGLLAAALEPTGRFGKFCMVVLAMSTSTACPASRLLFLMLLL